MRLPLCLMRYILKHISDIIEQYNGDIPLTHFLKRYYKQHTKLGSRDRKILSEMTYCWYRCSKAVLDIQDFEQKLYLCLFLSDTENSYAGNFLPIQWQEGKQHSLQEKIAILATEGILVDVEKINAYSGEFSYGIKKHEWSNSLLQQPSLFIRIRRDRQIVTKLLGEHGVPYHEISESCLSLPNGSSIDKFLPPALYVIQDASSQQTGNYFQVNSNEYWWDCCSGAGGKSLLLKDKERTVKLTVSDKRQTILHNLEERFALYGHKPDRAFTLDMSDASSIKKQMRGQLFDNIICDVPCSGSGTWARTPEQAYFFDQSDLSFLSELQYSIARNAAVYLKQGGTLYYITCSVFKSENENVVEKLKADGLKLKELTLINGIAQRADCLFIALLEKE